MDRCNAAPRVDLGPGCRWSTDFFPQFEVSQAVFAVRLSRACPQSMFPLLLRTKKRKSLPHSENLYLTGTFRKAATGEVFYKEP
jgi:hypothetical protein